LICACHQCRRCYWKYRPDWDTPGFCSWFCRELWHDKPAAHRADDPGIPAAILELIRSHNWIVHHGDSDFAWQFGEPCAECDRLETLHLAAIAYHMPAEVAPVSIAAEASRRSRRRQSSERKKGNFHVA
jgi:hypothetical protein